MVQPMRSLLYSSPLEEDRIQAAADSDADVVILDLESMVDDSQKVTARNRVSSVLNDYDFDDKLTCVRINDLRSNLWIEDISMTLESEVDAIRIPDVRRPSDLQTVIDISDSVSDPPQVLFQLESPEGIARGSEIASICKSHAHVVGIGLGLNDYLAQLSPAEDPAESFIRDQVAHLMAGFADVGDLLPLGCVYRGTDKDGLTAHAERLRALGHYGQPVLDINHVPYVNEIFEECYE